MKYFTADTHFGHRKLVRAFAPNGTLEYMLTSCRNYGKNDELYILGDVCWRDTNDLVTLANTLKCTIHVLPGNHDSKAKLKAVETRRLIVHDSILNVKSNGNTFVLCHYPLVEWAKQFHGSYHLHGHSHGTIKNRSNLRCMDVGLDVENGRIYSEVDIIEILSKCPYEERYHPTTYEFERVHNPSMEFIS